MGVRGIGGFFFRASDPDGLARWYREHLGIQAGHDAIWNQEAGMTVFAPFKQDSDYFSADKGWMLNLRVDGLGAMIETLEASGIAVITKPEWEDTGYGRFARIHDPAGNPIEPGSRRRAEPIGRLARLRLVRPRALRQMPGPVAIARLLARPLRGRAQSHASARHITHGPPALGARRRLSESLMDLFAVNLFPSYR